MSFSISCFSGVLIGGTRVVYDGINKESSISIKNPDKKSYLIQSWIEDVNGKVQNEMPLIVTPPLFKIEPENGNALRIVSVDKLNQEQETAFWLNIKSIPTSNPDAKNELHISINNRIKIFYRPKSLNKKDASLAYEKLNFRHKGNVLTAKNPTPYYVSFGELNINGKAIENPGMIAPNSELNWDVKLKKSDNNISWNAINDFGGMTKSLSVKT